MREVLLTDGRALTQADLNRSGALPVEIMTSAEAIVDDVRQRGDAAVRDYCNKFDGACPASFRVPQELIDEAPSMVDPEFLRALTRARDQIRAFHEKEREESWFTTRPDGTILGVKVTPVASAAVYVPGGRAQYPSTVLMDTIPAKVAGVPRVVMVTPPQKDGSLSAYTLAAAKLAGVDEVYAVGGAQAIGAVAYGTESIPACDKIVGPGNAFVAAAKRYVSGDVGIDMVAGPSEVCVLADATADPVVVAADLMAQAGHDPLASCYLVTCDAELPARVLAAAPEVRAVVEHLSGLGGLEAHEHPQQSAFAAARRADHHDDLAGLDSKADIIQHGGLAIGLDQMFNSQNRFCHVRSLPFLFEIGCQQTDGPAYEEI